MADKLFALLADPTRRAIFERIAAAPCPVSEIAAALPVSLPAVSQHLKILREAGLVTEERRGRQRVYHLRHEALEQQLSYLESLRTPPAIPSAGSDSLERNAARLGMHDDWPDLDPNLIRVSFRIRNIAHLMEQSMRETAASVGMQSGELLVLDALRRQGPPFESTPTQLKDATWITLAGLGKRLDRLEAVGHIERRPDPRDGRSNIVRLTPKGRRALEHGLHISRDNADFLALNEMAPGDRAQLAELLRRLQGRIEELRNRTG